jgi:hypothetical protein
MVVGGIVDVVLVVEVVVAVRASARSWSCSGLNVPKVILGRSESVVGVSDGILEPVKAHNAHIP